MKLDGRIRGTEHHCVGELSRSSLGDWPSGFLDQIPCHKLVYKREMSLGPLLVTYLLCQRLAPVIDTLTPI